MDNLAPVLAKNDYVGFFYLIKDKKKIPEDQVNNFMQLICGMCA